MWSTEQVAQLCDEATKAVAAAQHHDNCVTSPAWQDLVRPPGEAPAVGGAGPLLDLFSRAAQASLDHGAPTFMGFMPSAGLPSAAVAKMVAAAFNRFTGVPDNAPAMVRLEQALMRWMCDTFGLPVTATGVMTSGTSLATLTAVVAARVDILGEDLSNGTAYVTSQTHHCVAKALRIAGLPATAVRAVPVDCSGRMDAAATAQLIAADRRAGKRPFLVAVTAGTTNSGAIDPLPQLADVAAAEGVWMHVDAAYGGGFQLTGRGRARLAGIEHADSVALDPPKSWFLPFGTGVLLVRRASTLRRAFAASGDYLTDLSEHTLPTYSDLSPELTREFRALQLWFPLHLHGVAAFRDALDRMLDLAYEAHQRLSGFRQLETGASPQLSVVTFRLRDGSDEDNQRLVKRLNHTGRIFVSGTVIDGHYTLRLVFLNPRCQRRHLDEILDVIAAELDRGEPDPCRTPELLRGDRCPKQ
jgi:aromatic-L-amino-acid decarboxylase